MLDVWSGGDSRRRTVPVRHAALLSVPTHVGHTWSDCQLSARAAWDSVIFMIVRTIMITTMICQYTLTSNTQAFVRDCLDACSDEGRQQAIARMTARDTNISTYYNIVVVIYIYMYTQYDMYVYIYIYIHICIYAYICDMA